MSDIELFCRLHHACQSGREWALANCKDMVEVWDTAKPSWLVWVATRRGVLDAVTLRLFACRCVRETPLQDGRFVWDLLDDERSRAAVETAERYAREQATLNELWHAREAAWVATSDPASCAAHATALSAEDRAAFHAAGHASDASDRVHCCDVYEPWLRELPNPFAREPR
jgi:hypothetical protein